MLWMGTRGFRGKCTGSAACASLVQSLNLSGLLSHLASVLLHIGTAPGTKGSRLSMVALGPFVLQVALGADPLVALL